MRKNGLAENISLRSVFLLPGKFIRFIFPALLILFIFAVKNALNRDLWFDEALTVLHFALLESPQEIYNSYLIPNNQIVHTVFLHWWLKFLPQLPLRLLPLMCAILSCGLIWKYFRKNTGTIPLTATLGSMMISPVFVTYATALRGYMLAALLVIPALKSAMDFARSGNRSDAVKYTLWSLLAVGTMPGVLAALTAAGLYAMPLGGKKFYAKLRCWLLLLLPTAAVGIFYAGNFAQLLQCAKLGEGWHSGGAMVVALGAAMVYTFLPLLPAAVTGGVSAVMRRWRRKKWQFASRTVIWLLPVMAAAVFPTAPFPRVFFPMFPVLVLLLAGGIKELAAIAVLRKIRVTPVYISGFMVVIAAWSALSFLPALREKISPVASGGGQDDYRYCHYMKDEFTPAATAAKVAEISPVADNIPVFATFNSDPWALNYYADRQIFFDGPRGKIAAMPENSIAILHKKQDDAEKVAARFGMQPKVLAETPMHLIIRLEK